MEQAMRKIHIQNHIWEYRVGRQNVVIRSPQGFGKIKGAIVSCHIIKGLSNPDTFDRGKHKRTSDGMVKPSEVKAYIERNWY
jgi:hypothetical protein